MSYYPEPDSLFGDKAKPLLELSNYSSKMN